MTTQPDVRGWRRPSFAAATRCIREALGSRPPRRLEVDGFRRAAVLVPLLSRPGGPSILFTRRTETVNSHKGQISFPGGQLEAGEEPAAGALREAAEEVGLGAHQVVVAGCLDDQPSVSRFIVTPVVGLISEPPPSFTAQEAEVLEAFEVPLARLLDRDRFRWETWPVSRLPAGAPREELLRLGSDFEELDTRRKEYKVYFFAGGEGPEKLIWGLTARVLKGLLDRAFDFSPGRKAEARETSADH